jgi:hypothetical protein
MGLTGAQTININNNNNNSVDKWGGSVEEKKKGNGKTTIKYYVSKDTNLKHNVVFEHRHKLE